MNARAVSFTALALAFAFTTTYTLAQPRGRAPHAAATHAPPAKKPKADAGAPADSSDAGAEPMSARPEKENGGRAQDAGAASSGSGQLGGSVLEQKTLDGGAKVFRFGEIEIEGRLKSPQLVYFLRRVRAEFAAGDLGHRSFMHELSDTRRESSF
jgi:hypothetical protein